MAVGLGDIKVLYHDESIPWRLLFIIATSSTSAENSSSSAT